MVQTIKSVLFVDFDSIYTNLQKRDLGAGDLLATRSASWLGGIESGNLIDPKPAGGVQRQLMVKRCYADPKLLNKGRSWLAAKGVQIVDCPPSQGRDRNSAHAHMILDAIDALEHASGFDEFILMTADADLGPMLNRLRGYDRRSIIYASQGTSSAYRANSDGAIEESSLLSLLRSGKAGASGGDAGGIDFDDRPADLTVDRATLSALARRVNQAAKVPLFSTKVFADLFRLLALEVAENGYRFQKTAENVAGRMTALGRNVTRRQVGFVVKGLALRGHVFSASDRPDELAATFYQQVLFLTRNAHMKLSNEEERLIGIWIVGRGGHVVRSATPAAEPVEAVAEAPAAALPPEPVVEPEPEPEIEEIEMAEEAEPVEDLVAEDLEPELEPEPEPEPEPRPQPVRRPEKRPAAVQAPPARELRPIPSPKPVTLRPLRPTTPRPVPQPERTEARGETPSRPSAPARKAPAAPQPVRAPAPEPQRSAFAQRMRQAAASGPKDDGRNPRSAPPPREQGQQRRPMPSRGGRPAPAAGDGAADVENSILAAIAEAVEVSVDEGTGKAADRPTRVQRPATRPLPPRRRPERAQPPAQNDDPGGDIGDEIQRILAGYNRDQSRR